MFSKTVRAAILGAIAGLLAGCIMYPVTPDVQQNEVSGSRYSSELQQIAVLHSAMSPLASHDEDNLGDEFIKEVEQAIAKSKHGVEVIESGEFLKQIQPDQPAAQPINVARLLELGQENTESAAVGIARPDYLLLVIGQTAGSGTGTYIPFLLGVGTAARHTSVEALLIDWTSGHVVHAIVSDAEGHGGGLVWIVIPFGLFPETESRTASVLGELVAKRVSEFNHEGVPRVLVLLGERNIAGSTQYLLGETEALEEAKKGSRDAQLQVYFSKVADDPDEAHLWLCKSADAGHPDARSQLALLYENGAEGLEKDYVRAYIWYVLAARSDGYMAEMNALRLKTQNLDAESIAAAEDALRKWQPGQCANDLRIAQDP